MGRLAALLAVVGLMGCTGHAEWMRRGTDSGELRLRGPASDARADADRQIGQVCGGHKFSSAESATRVGNKIVQVVHFDCAKE